MWNLSSKATSCGVQSVSRGVREGAVLFLELESTTLLVLVELCFDLASPAIWAPLSRQTQPTTAILLIREALRSMLETGAKTMCSDTRSSGNKTLFG